MKYSVNFNGKDCELIPYSFDIMEMIDKQEKINNSDVSVKEKCRSMYSLCTTLLNPQYVSDVIGEFESADPNAINILYLKIINSYNSPLTEYQSIENANKIEKVSNSVSSIEKLLSMLEKVEKSSK